jgi:hypothetical protein
MARAPVPLDFQAASSDAEGVFQHRLNGRTYDHPVGQARLATAMLAAHRLTGDDRYLVRGEANVQRLVDTAVEARGTLYLPYRYEHRLAGAQVRPVWFSAMAQGLAMSAAFRMYYVTEEPSWATFAERIFISFLRPPTPRRPWTVHVDACGHLWLDEYPRPTHGRAMRVLNGHISPAV